METQQTDPFELTKQLIEHNGLDGAIEIARRNCWDGVLAQCLALAPALDEHREPSGMH
ncbi:MAG: hypothetical protein QF926_00630 [Alphaproteobacteria bacterium]|jgi:hypothetical protein|nr:hypothetical protein [Alphaproteobacteria bacterium]MDP6515115.1 hypothetical protein [Alphaproteobacteria bacterium]|tara:strand:+ start:682 stop:855 length:174 start_codon:yes stop_codon:yes gene_type:complete